MPEIQGQFQEVEEVEEVEQVPVIDLKEEPVDAETEAKHGKTWQNYHATM